jgi:hypothetical protein
VVLRLLGALILAVLLSPLSVAALGACDVCYAVLGRRQDPDSKNAISW